MKEQDGKYSTIHYQKYLMLDNVLSAQELRSEQLGEPAHEEMLFIIVHQVYELWFKQIIHELKSVKVLFDDEEVVESSLSVAVGRLNRVKEIFELMVKQIGIMETMTPLDFLDFRNYLFPASGFQSFQFRVAESMLGLPNKQRITYHGHHYSSPPPRPVTGESVFSLGLDIRDRFPLAPCSDDVAHSRGMRQHQQHTHRIRDTLC